MWVVLSVSDSDKHFEWAIKEYEKRMGKSIRIDQVKPTRWDDHKKAIIHDTEQIIALLSKKYADYFKVYLSKDGKTMATEQFADLLKKNLNVVFVIGWPYGLDESLIQKYINLKIPSTSFQTLSFGQMTLQHGLAKLVLLEQLYRISTIWQGRQYHY